MWTIDKRDEFIHGEKVSDEFNLHVIPSEGEPLAHLTRFRVPQVVVFGSEQKLRTPISLSAGRHIMITAPTGSETVTISRFEANAPDQQITTTTSLADVIRAVGKLKAAYPDIAQMLVQADRQSNLPGRLEIDAMPQGGRIYHRPSSAGQSGRKEEITVGDPAGVPNMFPVPDAKRGKDAEPADREHDSPVARNDKQDEAGEASLVDVRDGDEAKASGRSGGFLGLFRRKSEDEDTN